MWTQRFGILAPLFVVVAAVIWLESKGPIFYGDKREGQLANHWSTPVERTLAGRGPPQT